MERIESIVARRTAAWLVPQEQLAEWTWSRAEVEPVTARLVAEEFGVTIEVAERALGDLARRYG